MKNDFGVPRPCNDVCWTSSAFSESPDELAPPSMKQHAMVTRLNWEKNNLARKPTCSLKDEREFRERDLAARWLERREKWEQTAAKIRQWKRDAKSKRAYRRSKHNKRK